MQQITDKLDQFGIEGNLVNVKLFSSGHINTTYLVEVEDAGKINKYILQKINKYVFKKPDEVMQNIMSITTFIKDKIIAKGKNAYRRVLNFKVTKDKLPFVIDNEEDYWRIYEFIDNSVCYDKTDDPKILEETGKAFGEFQLYLDNYPISKLNLTIPNFHNLPMRYEWFKQIIKNNALNRAENVLNEIDDFFCLEAFVSRLNIMQEQGFLPLRVTHNDTKCNNVLFDKNSKNYLCVIDLDTVMPGLVSFDYGDAIRCIASTASEDEIDLSKVKLDINKFKAFTRGFLAKVGDKLTDKEKETLALGAITITTELALRFLTDYLEGDKYFKINYDEHNLDRARCQLALAKDMLKKYDQMQQIINDCLNQQIECFDRASGQ